MLLQIAGFAQIRTEQIFVGNAGKFGDDSDHVTIASINPDDQSSTFFGEVVRESIQDLIIADGYVFIAAEDSIAKFNIATGEKENIIYHGNLNRLYFHNDQLLVSMRSDLNGPPADGKYLKSFDMDLNLLHEATGISSDAAGMVVLGDSIYLAVSGDWQATEGKLAVISADLSFTREINLGADAVGTYDLFASGENIYAVNKSPWGATSGSITTYKTNTTEFTNNVIANVVGKGVEMVDDILYLGLDNGIGSYDLSTGTVINSQIAPDPGSASYIAIAAAAFDRVNELIYVTITDYNTFGEGKVYDLEGNHIASFDATISAEAMAIHYVDETAVTDISNAQIQVYPNPTTSLINIESNQKIEAVSVYNELGVMVYSTLQENERFSIDLSNLKTGFYFVRIESDASIITKKVLKQ